MHKYPIIVIDGASLPSRKFDGSHPDVFWLETNNSKGFRQTHLIYYFIIIRVASCFDPVGYLCILHVLLIYFIVLKLMKFYAFWILLLNYSIRHWTGYNYYL